MFIRLEEAFRFYSKNCVDAWCQPHKTKKGFQGALESANVYIYHLDPHYAFLFNTDQPSCSFMLLVFAATGIQIPNC
jgi:hypothetical protein